MASIKSEEKSILLAGQSREGSLSLSSDVEGAPEVGFYNVSGSKASESSCNWKGFLCLVGLLVFALAVLGALFGAGVVVGRNSAAASEHRDSCNDWGNNATIGGKNVSVINWFDGEMSADNIKKSLAYVYNTHGSLSMIRLYANCGI